jgi:hypothetical protein
LVGWRAQLASVLPGMLAHEGIWTGTYRHLDAAGRLIDVHASHVTCAFPDTGPFAYIQTNRFSWSDGRVQTAQLPGTLNGDRLFWDVETFSGSAFAAGDGMIGLNLIRKDVPGASFLEIITPPTEKGHRARTWHWFRDGVLTGRTLCDERRSGQPVSG